MTRKMNHSNNRNKEYKEYNKKINPKNIYAIGDQLGGGECLIIFN
jgi:hypothetical protein